MLSVYDLPAYRVGPYTMRPTPGAKASFPKKRSHQSNDWVEGITKINDQFTGRRLLLEFVRHLCIAIHYRSGLNNDSNEESYTQSLASGLIEIANNSPEFWVKFNALLGQELGKQRWFWDRCAAGDGTLDIPKRVVMGHWSYRFVRMKTNPDFYGWCNYEKERIEISDELHGTQLCMIVLHECVHFMHWAQGLEDGNTQLQFERWEAEGLLKFWEFNPRLWAWLLHGIAASKSDIKSS